MLERAALTKIHLSLQPTRTIQPLYCNHRTWHADKLERESRFVYDGSDGIHWKGFVWLLWKQIPAPLWRVLEAFGSGLLPAWDRQRIIKPTCLQVTLRTPPHPYFYYKGKEGLKCSVDKSAFSISSQNPLPINKSKLESRMFSAFFNYDQKMRILFANI